ncbi:MAG: SufS family cysteine desulfurase [Planctomycetota bacterium]|nr:MAG: SufS family cysteine desulfurase [Planctomycetota bacterium]
MAQEETAVGWDLEAVRAAFPILAKPLSDGRRLTYLDTAASAQKPQSVIDAERAVYETYYANAYRGVYEFGARIDEAIEATRETVRRFIGAGEAEEIIFTRGTTESLNVVASGWGRRFLDEGDEIVVTLLEHHANLVPWQQVALETGARLRYIELTPEGRLDPESIEQAFTERTRLLAVTAMSNVLGTEPPLAELCEVAHEYGALVVVDAAQSVSHSPIDVQALGADFLAFSGHKLYGPTGVGVLWGRRELLEQMQPFVFGGHMIEVVERHRATWAPLPAKFEGGTLPIAQIIALKTAIEFVQGLGLSAIRRHEHEVLQYAHQRLREVPGMRIYGPPVEEKGPIVSFTVDGAHAEDLANLLDLHGVFVRHGHHCTMPLHEWLNVPATVRASFGVYSGPDDVDALVEGLLAARRRLRLDRR